uniref:RNA-directed RNA polymerase L n=1 Tax=Phytophthora palustris bunya-like virus 4 TaxID=2976283 RepID=A0A9E8Z4L5_9VIRU|nr:RNA-dependent RNA polymerase [Phytophthora palustris bunya-like virus 4]
MFKANTTRLTSRPSLTSGLKVASISWSDFVIVPIDSDRFSQVYGLAKLLFNVRSDNRSLVGYEYNLQSRETYIQLLITKGVQLFIKQTNVLTSRVESSRKLFLVWTDSGDFWAVPRSSKIAIWSSGIKCFPISYTIPDHNQIVPVVSWPTDPLEMNAYDLGGSGDCAILCFIARFCKKTAPTVDSIYRIVGLEPGSFLESEHLIVLCHLFKTNMLVIRIADGNLTFNYFKVSDSYAVDICLLNLYPYHFCLVRDLFHNGSDMIQHTFSPVPGIFSNEDSGIRLDYTLHRFPITRLMSRGITYFELFPYMERETFFLEGIPGVEVEIHNYSGEDDFEYASDAEDEEEIDPVLDLQILPLNSSAELVFHYMRNHPKMHSASNVDVLNAFKVLHHEVVNLMMHHESLSLHLPSIFYKYYYKCRHNTFAYLCIHGLNRDEMMMETDTPLSKYIESSKTPDYILETEKDITLFEFTVSNRYEQADFIKGGGIINTKYQQESELISKKMGKPCTVRIVPGILNEYNSDEVERIMGWPLDKHALRAFYDISNKSRDKIASAYFSSGIAREGLVEGSNILSDNHSSINVDAFFVSMMLRNWSWFLNYTVRLIQKYGESKPVSLCYDIFEKRAKVDIEPGRKWMKIKLSELMEVLGSNDLSAIISHLNVFDGNKRVGLASLSGDIMITMKRQAPRSERIVYSAPITELKTYSVMSSKGDSYDSIKEWSEDLIMSSNPIKYDFDDNYLDKLSSFDFKSLLQSSDPRLLANNKMSAEYVEESVEILRLEYLHNNSNPRFKFSPKPTFTWPMVTGVFTKSSLTLDQTFLKKVSSEIKGVYTRTILDKAIRGQFYTESIVDDDIKKARDNYSMCRQEYTLFLIKNNLVKRYITFTSEERSKVSEIRSKMVKGQQELSRLMGIGKRKSINLVKVICKKKTAMRRHFEEEMKHYHKNRKGLRGVGSEYSYDKLLAYFTTLHERLMSKNADMALSPLYNRQRSPGNEFLTECKNDFTNRWDSFYNEHFKTTLLENITEVIGRLSKFLFNESMKSYNSDFVKIDNLGFTDMIVIVRGGPKAAKHNCCRLFRMVFPIDERDLIYSGYEQNENYQILSWDAKYYILTPWSQYHLDAIYDGFSARERCFTSLYSSCVRTQVDSEKILPKLNLLPMTLMMNNRRKTESLMHNLRYLIVNPLGLYANIHSIIKIFGTFNHTYLGAWLKASILKNYNRFATAMMELIKTKDRNLDNKLKTTPLKDMFFSENIINSEQLTFHIYDTYLMTKAPVNNTLEQVNNLKEILCDVKMYEEKHSDVDGMKDDSQHINVFDFDAASYDDDFTYDPVFCQYLGFHMSNFLRNKITPSEMEVVWDRLMEQGLSKIANSNGLRGYKESNFFSKKGFEVVFDKVIDTLQESDSTLDEMIDRYMNADYKTSCDMIKSEMIRKKDLVLDQITFHIVHKIQRGGGREIFCMDMMTKIFQNPIEMFMKYLCKQVPNEFISIPSNKRHGLIHRDFYERSPSPWIKETIRWVLDCRRWAPHSVFQKYVHFIHGMSSFLPGNFVHYFGAFADKMFKKQFCTRTHVVNAIKGNKTFDGLTDILKPDAKVPGKYNFNVKFSFVMGIFNYLSTLMHSANQMVCSEVSMRNNLTWDRGLVVMDAKCHSDDSVVTTYHEKSVSIRPTVLIYDWLLKCANHMLSIKKSQINRNVYLEFLSTLYIFDRFIPVVPKFISTIPFKPTDLGYPTDVTFAASQSIEMLLQGGTIEESFLMLKVTERFVQNIYNLNPNPQLPYSLMGNIDCHPVELLLSGVESDVINHYLYNKDRLLSTTQVLIDHGVVSSNGIEGFNIVWDMSSKVSHKLLKKYSRFDKILSDLNRKYPWTLSQCKLGNDYLQLIWYLNKLRSPKYYASIIQEPGSRLFTRIFGSARYRNIFLKNGSLMKVSDLTNLLQYSPSKIYYNQDVEEYYSSLNLMNPYMEELHDVFMTTEITGHLSPSSFKMKPVTLNITSSRLDRVKMSTQEIISYIYETEAYRLLGKAQDPVREVERVKQFVSSVGLKLPEADPDLAMKVVDFALGRKEPKYSMIGPLPSDEKRIDDYNGVVVYIMHNSFWGHIMDVTTTRADVIDWAKKVSRGKTPKLVVDYMEITQMIKIAKSLDVYDLDLYKVDLTDIQQERFNDLPIHWKPLVYSTTKRTLADLIEENYWTLWYKEQIKVNRNWYGSGKCLVSLPEVVMQITIRNGVIDEIGIRDETHTELSVTSNWYLLSILSQPGLKLPTIPSDTADQTKDFLGYNNNTGLYGFGSPRAFDRVFFRPTKLGIDKESLLYNTTYYENKDKLYVVDNDNKYLLEQYASSDTNTIDFSRYLDREKVLKGINDKRVKNFCLKVSYNMRKEFSFRKEDVVDTIGFTKLYKLIYNHPDSIKVFQGQRDPDVFYESFPLWKKTNPDFGYPDDEEMDALIETDHTQPLPPRVLRLLHKLGRSTIPESEKDSIMTSMYHTPKEDRISYLMSVMGSMNQTEQSNMLVLALRSTRFYDSCKMLGKKTFLIFTPLMKIIMEALDNSPCVSETLENIQMKYSRSMPRSVVFSYLMARVIFTALYTNNVLSENDPVCQLVLKIIEEMFDTGLPKVLNTISARDPILRSIEFDVEKSVFLEMVLNVLDSLYLTEWTRRGYPTERQRQFPYESEYAEFIKPMLKIKKYMLKKGMTIVSSSKKRINKIYCRATKPTLGVIDSRFTPLNEDDMEEFEAGYTYLSDPEEDLEFEEEGEAPELRFVNIPCCDRIGMMTVRGTAHTLMIKTSMLSLDIHNCYGVKRFYQINQYSNLEEFVSEYGSIYINKQ